MLTRPQILIVDDDPIALEMLQTTLEKAGHKVSSARNGHEALARLEQEPIRMVITDWVMEPMDGLQLCRAIRSRHFSHYVYIIMLSARDERANIAQGLAAGADDFVTKPFDPAELAARIKAGQRILSLEMRDVTIFALARLAESRDTETGLHLERVRNYVRILAEELADGTSAVTADFIQLLYDTSPLHDIGKVAIPDAILLKPGKLTPPEYEMMKRHVEIGVATVEDVLHHYPDARFLEMARDIIATHHEKFDGSGYPKKLAGEAIPWCGQLMALADAYDAITSKRVYKAARSREEARTEIRAQAGRHFNPGLVEAFAQREEDMWAFHQQSLQWEQAPEGSAPPQTAWLRPIRGLSMPAPAVACPRLAS